MELITKPLEGLDFDMATQNCYTCARGFYLLNSHLTPSDYACPYDWDTAGLDLFADIIHDEGFKIVHDPPRAYRVGDIPLMAIGANVGNHIGVIMPGNRMLHHMIGMRSSITSYGGLFRNNTVAVYRHPDVLFQPHVATMPLAEALPPNARRRLENYIARSGSQKLPE